MCFWQARFALLTRLGGMNESDVTEEEWRQITTLTEGYSAADLKSLCTQVCVCVCVCEGAGERETERHRERVHCTARARVRRRLESPLACALAV